MKEKVIELMKLLMLIVLFLSSVVLQAADLTYVDYPFHPTERILCDQGSQSPDGNSHTYSNTLYALDLATPKGSDPSDILASADGYVITYDQCVDYNTNCGSGFGNHVKLLRSDGVLIMYAHLNSVSIKTGEFVKKGQFIGVEGNTGLTGYDNRHLHFSVHSDWRKNGFDYYKKHIGSLPDSIPYAMNICQEKYNTCHARAVDVREIKCKRVTGEVEWVTSYKIL